MPVSETILASVKEAGDTLAYCCHTLSKDAGWWDGSDPHADPLVFPTKLMLAVSELSEAMEGHRKGLRDDKLPHRSMAEVEIGDAIIRLFDLAGRMGYDVGGAIREKLIYNTTRPDHTRAARAAAGGKAY